MIPSDPIFRFILRFPLKTRLTFQWSNTIFSSITAVLFKARKSISKTISVTLINNSEMGESATHLDESIQLILTSTVHQVNFQFTTSFSINNVGHS